MKVTRATASKIIAVGTNDQAMILVRRLPQRIPNTMMLLLPSNIYSASHYSNARWIGKARGWYPTFARTVEFGPRLRDCSTIQIHGGKAWTSYVHSANRRRENSPPALADSRRHAQHHLCDAHFCRASLYFLPGRVGVGQRPNRLSPVAH